MSPSSPLADLMSLWVRSAADRGRSSVKRRLSATRTRLERRQLEQDRERFWIRLGKTAFRLAEDDAIHHPAIDKAVARIREIDREIAQFDSRPGPDLKDQE